MLRKVPKRTALLAAAVGLSSPCFAQLGIGPNGKDFIVGMMQVNTAADMAQVSSDGFNMVNTYLPGYYMSPDQYMQTAASYGLDVSLSIGVAAPGYESYAIQPTAANVQHFSQYSNLAEWYMLPETASVQTMADTSAIIHNNDPSHPIDFYLPADYPADDGNPNNYNNIRDYLPFVDSVSDGIYPTLVLKPRPWVRWQIEQEVLALNLAGNPRGKFPNALLQMFPPEPGDPNYSQEIQLPNQGVMSAADAYHDAYLALVSGAKSITVLGYGHIADTGQTAVYQSYSNVARQLNGPQRLGEVFLFGTQLPASGFDTTITSGPQMSQAFTPAGASAPVQYGSISSRVTTYQGNIYITSVNSATLSVGAQFSGIRSHSNNQAQVLFESRNVTISNEKIADTFAAQGVHTYKLPPDADLVVAQDPFDSINAWSLYVPGGTITASNGIATVTRGAANTEYFRKSIPAGTLPTGGFIELTVKADPATQFYLELVAPDGSSTAVIPFQAGSGTWETVQAPFSGSWTGTNSLFLGITQGDTFQVDSLGVYFRASPIAESTWASNSNGNWSAPGSWSSGVPTTTGAVADFTTAISAPRTVTVDAPQTLGVINFQSVNSYTLVGSSPITLQALSGSAAIHVIAGSHTISAALQLASPTTFDVAPASTLTINNLRSSPQPITKTGSGRLAVNRIAASALDVQSGTVALTSTLAGMVNALNVTSGSNLDLARSGMVVSYQAASPFTSLNAYVTDGRISSSQSTSRTTVGIAEAAPLGITSFLGQAVTGDAVLLRCTYLGDANLDGSVNAIDFNMLASGFGSSGGWQRGDFDRSGAIDTTDFTLLAMNFNQPPLGAPLIGAVVPGPTAGLLAYASLVLFLVGSTRRNFR